jgi:hypothetical protein
VQLESTVEILQHSQRWYFHLCSCLFFPFTILLQYLHSALTKVIFPFMFMLVLPRYYSTPMFALFW